MTREIKFRAWEKPDKKVNFDGSMHYDVVGNDYFGKWLYSDDYEIMQYTGLKDKNGKEIFEGDIVTTLSGKIYPVQYLDECAMFEPFGDGDYAEWGKVVEVVGNIYENPELITSRVSIML